MTTAATEERGKRTREGWGEGRGQTRTQRRSPRMRSPSLRDRFDPPSAIFRSSHRISCRLALAHRHSTQPLALDQLDTCLSLPSRSWPLVAPLRLLRRRRNIPDWTARWAEDSVSRCLLMSLDS